MILGQFRRHFHFASKLNPYIKSFEVVHSALHAVTRSFSNITDYALVSLHDYMIQIGGVCDFNMARPTNIIMRYQIDRWTQVGRLLSSRWSHNAILNDDRVFIIGGLEFHRIDPDNSTTFGT